MVKGFKVFNPDWTCRGFNYEVGQTYEMDSSPRPCKCGFHFCEVAADCFDYYQFNPENKVAEILAHGEVAVDGNKSCTNKIEIVREIPWAELLTIVNTGKGNSGLRNTGDRNTGIRNTGDCNTGLCNTGDCNTGDCNTGGCNTGDCNTGDWNTGGCNTGSRNTGDCNTRDFNTGSRNTGSRNTGDCNTGIRSTGDWNQSDFCSGDFNLADHETGCFCTVEHPIRFFDKESSMTFREWRNSKAYALICRIRFIPTKWVSAYNMTDEEKAAHPEFETTNGYLKTNDLTPAFQDWWNSLTGNEKSTIQEIPNFDPAKFKMLTGITV